MEISAAFGSRVQRKSKIAYGKSHQSLIQKLSTYVELNPIIDSRFLAESLFSRCVFEESVKRGSSFCFTEFVDLQPQNPVEVLLEFHQ